MGKCYRTIYIPSSSSSSSSFCCNVYLCLAERELPDALPVVRQPKMDRQTHDNRPETCPFRHGARVRAFLFCFVLSINTKTIKKYTHPHSRRFFIRFFFKVARVYWTISLATGLITALTLTRLRQFGDNFVAISEFSF